VLLAQIVHLVFYLILKKNYNLDADVFLYGFGFISSFIPIFLLSYILVALDKPIDFSLYWLFFVIPLVSLFYSYAALPKNNEKKISTIALFLIAFTAVFFIFLIMKDEMFQQFFLVFILPIFFGLYVGYYAIYRTVRLSSRSLAWTPILMLFIFFINPGMFFHFILESFLHPFLSVAVVGSIASFISLFISSFIVVYVIGTIRKQLIKKKEHAENV
jgi:hypothetical protein